MLENRQTLTEWLRFVESQHPESVIHLGLERMKTMLDRLGIRLCILPAGYVALRLGCDAPSVFYISIVFTLVSGFVRFLFCHKQIGYSLRRMASEVLLPIAGVSILSLPLPIVIKSLWLGAQTCVNFILLCFIAASITVIVSWFVGLKAHERQTLVYVVKNKLHKK